MIGVLIWLLIAACALLAYFLIRIKSESRCRLEEADAIAQRLAATSENYHQKLRALSESSGAGILMIDHRGIVVHSNAIADEILGGEPESMIGHALIRATLSSEMQHFVLHAANCPTPQSQDFQIGSPPRVIRASVYPLPKGLSGAEETMLVLADVTQLRKLETIRQEFVANVSHELRTPLASIRAMAEALEDGALQDDQVAQKFLGTIIRETDRLARISEDLLILSDAESKEPKRDLFDLDILLRDVIARSTPHAIERGIDLKLEIEGRLPVRAARDQLEQVVVNLVDNAIKYTGQGGRIRVIAGLIDDKIRVEVNDTGIGIMEEHLPRLFERFYRVDKARSRDSGGTGLGLSIVKNIVERHGGEVAVASEFNHGSTFTILLPCAGESV
ncbi:MAG TPA: ATP-binding protein [Fimbriimonadaceae bacterium]|nr:ATP-binding protein [Fimbriimonadaceae bacterium]